MFDEVTGLAVIVDFGISKVLLVLALVIRLVLESDFGPGFTDQGFWLPKCDINLIARD